MAGTFAPVKSQTTSAEEVTFLHRSRPLDIEKVDWRCVEESTLWQYNLHYFDYLHWDSYDESTKQTLIDNWIQMNPRVTSIAWDPYPVSLRIVNWIKYFLESSALETVPVSWVNSLAEQSNWLEVNLERHLLANHLFKNAKALTFSGMFFSGKSADRQLELGLNLMIEQVREQILPDGGHIERSPMYHCIVLEDLLDVLNLLKANPAFSNKDERTELRDAGVRAANFLRKMLLPGEKIPLFNDSAFGIAIEPGDLLDYSKKVLDLTFRDVESGSGGVALPDSGYYGFKSNGDGIIIDCGDIGPDYQPGHAHCDCLSFELYIDGRAIIVDSGVFDYEAGNLRQYLRSTAAHNTVRIDGEDQSEIWGTFRVARRARPRRAKLRTKPDFGMEFSGSHDGYRRLSGAPIHERRIEADGVGRWTVLDEVLGRGEHLVESFVHINSGLDLFQKNGSFLINDGTRTVAKLHIDSDCAVSISNGLQCPEFGRQQENKVLILAKRALLPISMFYSIEKV